MTCDLIFFQWGFFLKEIEPTLAYQSGKGPLRNNMEEATKPKGNVKTGLTFLVEVTDVFLRVLVPGWTGPGHLQTCLLFCF